MLNLVRLDTDQQNTAYYRSMVRCYDDLCQMPAHVRDTLSERDRRILDRTIWSMKQLLIAVGRM